MMIFGKHINRYYLRFLHLFILGITALVLVDYFQLIIPELFGELIDNINQKTLTEELLVSTVQALILIICIMFLGRFGWRICIFGLAVRIETDLRKRMFEKIEALSVEYFNVHKTGAQMALFTNDLMTVRRCFGSGTMMLVDALFLGVLTLIKMFRLQPILAVISLVPLVLIAIGGVIVEKYMSEKYKKRQEAYEDLSDFTQENFSGLHVIKAFVKEANELRRFRKINKYNEDTNMDFLKFSISLDVLLGAALNLILLIIIGVGGYYVIATKNSDNPFTIGDLSTYVAYFDTLIWPMLAISQLINMMASGRASLSRVSELLNEEPKVKDGPDVITDENILNNLKGEITFNNLTFNYPDSEINVLSNINLTIKPNEKIGIIGKTGCGKSTVVDLLLRLYNINENSILIDGIDIMKLPISSVRGLISYVPQDNFLFGTSIKENIAFGVDECTEEEIINVAKLADVHDNIIEFSNQYDTIMGERGVTVSGGQKQRISIARAMLKKSKIIIFDDSVSAVDTKTEKTILNNMYNKLDNMTVILIAHRISTVQDLDKIILLDNGKVIGFGSHEELLKTSKEYVEMVELQKLQSKVEGDVNE